MKYYSIYISFFLIFVAAGVVQAVDDNTKHIHWKLVWVWNMPRDTESQIEEAVLKAKTLGFNAIAWNPVKWQTFIEVCKKFHLESYYIVGIVTKKKLKGITQEISLEEQKLPASHKQSSSYQSGGEPLEGQRELLHSNLYCLCSPTTFQKVCDQIKEAVKRKYDGIAFDGIGYKNYRQCHCETCMKKFALYCQKHPEMNTQVASTLFSKKCIIDFYKKIIDYAKSLDPNIKTTCHIWPVFLPDILYGNLVPVDYCGQTVSWAYKPHWDLNKVRKYSKIVVEEQDTYHPKSIGAPFIALHAIKNFPKHKKTPERVREEIQIVKESGASAIQFTELGNILDDPGFTKVITQELKTQNN